jgi:phosphatidyl-myo-inositol alpha-mannosyltransferase
LRGHDVRIVTPQPRTVPDDCDVRGIIMLGGAADFKTPLHTTAQFSASIDTAEIDHMLQTEKFDILHFHEPWVPMLSRQILSRSNTVNIATFHAKLPENAMSRTITRVVTPYTKSVLKYLHELTAVSGAAAEYIRELTDRPVNIIPNGVDITHFSKIPKEADKGPSGKTVLYVGRLERRKGVKYLLKAFQLLQENNEEVSLVLAGDGPDREKLEELSANLGLRNVHFVGYVSEQEKLRLLHSADLFCAPALYGESFGVVLLEAMSSGLVTVASNNPGYASVMQGLGALSLVNPHDTVEFARRLDLLLREDSLRLMWQNWAKANVKQYSYKRIVDQYEGMYKKTYNEHTLKRRRFFRTRLVKPLVK